MKMKMPIIVGASLLTIGGATLFGVSSVSAESSSGNSLIERIAARFSLDEAEVEAVFDEYKEERRAEHKAQITERLADLVEDGTITNEQKTLLEAKLEEHRQKREELRNQDLSRQEHRDAMSELRDDFKQWLDDNGIDLDAILPIVGHGHGGRGMGAD
jgi:hypothetical protein